MESQDPGSKKSDELEKIKARMLPEGRILLFSLFAGFAFGPMLAFYLFQLAGTVPAGYSLSQFYNGIRIDLMNGVWMAWAVVLAPYALVQFGRAVVWSFKALKDSMSLPGS
jgi:hypothetical protein